MLNIKSMITTLIIRLSVFTALCAVLIKAVTVIIKLLIVKDITVLIVFSTIIHSSYQKSIRH